MEYATPLILDINAKENHAIIEVKQGDRMARKLAITVKKDGVAHIPSGYTYICFRCEKPDGHAVIVRSDDSDSGISVSGNVVTIPLHPQALIVPGKAYCDISFEDASNNVLSTASFIMNIVASPDVYNILESHDAYKELTEAIEEAHHAGEKVRFRAYNGYLQTSYDAGVTWNNVCRLSEIGAMTVSDPNNDGNIIFS